MKSNNYRNENIAEPVKFEKLNMLIIAFIICSQVSNLKDTFGNVFVVIRFTYSQQCLS